MRILCPNRLCRQAYKVSESHLGQRVVCRKCGAEFQVARPLEEADVEEQAPRPQADAADEPAAKPAELPGKIGRFEVRERLGAGAFGVVYRAFDATLKREVALKVPHAGRLLTDDDKARFLREARAAGKLRHPNIVPVFETGADGGRHYLATAFIEGRTLQEALEPGAFDFQRSARMVHDLANALHYAHRQGIVHRDVKPSNIMLDKNGHPLLMDFGLARFQEGAERLTQEGVLLGTPAYMSPEQAQGKLEEIGPASDQYSLGVVLYELLCGEPPFSGPPGLVISHVLHQDPPRPRVEYPERGIPRDLETICLKAIAKPVRDRYPDCAELMADLRRWLNGEPILAQSHVAGHATAILEPAWRWCRRNVAVLALGVVAILCFIHLCTGLVPGRVSPDPATASSNGKPEEPRGGGAVTNDDGSRKPTPQPVTPPVAKPKPPLEEPLGKKPSPEPAPGSKPDPVKRPPVPDDAAQKDAGATITNEVMLPPTPGLQCRDGPLKDVLLSAYGGNETGEAAVERALDWIERHQKIDGGWSFYHPVAACKTSCPDPGSLDQAPNAATALALLPLLGAGHGQSKSRFNKSVTSGITFLKNRMVRVGSAGTFFERAAPQMPSHALATLALSEACEGARDRGQTRAAALAAVYFIIQNQNPDGGWGARPKLPDVVADGSDVLSTGWNVLALKAAQWAGLPVMPEKALEKTLKPADDCLEKMLVSGARLGFHLTESAERTDTSATASGMLSRMYLGWPRGQQELSDYAGRLAKAGPSAGPIYLAFLNTQFMRDLDGTAWGPYHTALRDRLLATQATEGHGAGSWYFDCNDWGNKLGGRLFCTALAALVLEVYYRNPPQYTSVKTPPPVKPKPPPREKPPEPVRKLAEPDNVALKQAEGEIKGIYQDKLREAKTAAQKAALAADLVRDARGTKDNKVTPYVLLRMASDLYVESDNFDGALGVIDQIAAQYEVDTLELKSGLLARANKVAVQRQGDAVMRQKIADFANRLADDAVAEGQFDVASRALSTALNAALRTTNVQLRVATDNRIKDLGKLQAQYDLFKKSLGALESDPGNAKANTAAGSWYCFVAGNWEKGLAYLAKGDDQELVAVAKEDLTNPSNGDKQAALGDQWWNLSEGRKGPEAKRMQARAAEWYKQALPGLSGLARARLEKRIEGLGLSTASYALRFDGKSSYGIVQNLGYNGTTPITIEAVLRPLRHPRADNRPGIVFDGPPGAIFSNVTATGGLELGCDFYWRGKFHYALSALSSGTSSLSVGFNARVLADKWVHVALVSDGKELRLYVNGRLDGSTSTNYRRAVSLAPFVIGAEPATVQGAGTDAFHGFCGLMRGMRVSNTAVYTNNFTPPTEFRREKGTVLLFPMSEGKGTELRDASGNNKITVKLFNTEWVKLDREPKIDEGGGSPALPKTKRPF